MDMIHIHTRADGVAVVTLDHPDLPVNTLSPDLVEEFEAKGTPLLDDPGVRAVVLASAKPDTFIAGADLSVLETMERAEQASELSRRGNRLLSMLADSPKPVVAAVHGAALGGGLEVAMACHYIVASDDPATVLGLPEVMLGLLPAGGGTQRLPRRVGLLAALPMLLTGRRVRARKALRMGLVDAVTTPGGIVDTAARAAVAMAEGRLRRRPRRRGLAEALAPLPPLRSLVLRKARQQVQRRARGLYPAPPLILDCVATGLRKGVAAGLALESEHFGRLVVSPESRSLVWLFHAMNDLKKPGPDDRPQPVRRLALLGAGFMGAGVASVSLGRCPVVLRDISDEALAAGGGVVRDGLARMVRSGALRRSEADRRWSRLHLTRDIEAIAGADLVIEAVFEQLELKQKVLAEAEAWMTPEAVFASNTSALPIAAIAAHAAHPERVLGMHYFSPVPKMPLLEIVRTEATSDAAVATARAFGIAQGKSVIVVRDGPGFYTTRILAPYLNEAVLALEEGAGPGVVDAALKDLGFPVGPVALIDEVGLDVAAHVARDLGAAFAHRGLGASDALPRLHQAGLMGRKNRRGFYLYPPAGARGRKRPNPEALALLGGDRNAPPTPADLQDRLALLMVNEAVHCLQEGVIASPRDGDAGAVLGLGFPPLRGGPFRHVDALGAAAVVARLEALAAAHGPRFEPARLLRDMAASGRRFHE